MYLFSGMLGKNPSAPLQPSPTYDLPMTSSDALPLNWVHTTTIIPKERSDPRTFEVASMGLQWDLNP